MAAPEGVAVLAILLCFSPFACGLRNLLRRVRDAHFQDQEIRALAQRHECLLHHGRMGCDVLFERG